MQRSYPTGPAQVLGPRQFVTRQPAVRPTLAHQHGPGRAGPAHPRLHRLRSRGAHAGHADGASQGATGAAQNGGESRGIVNRETLAADLFSILKYSQLANINSH